MRQLSIALFGVILLSAFLLMFSVSLQESAIMDELAHIPAGYGYVKLLDGRLNPEHPPLVKMISALPLAFMNLNFPLEDASWQTDVNGQWVTGAKFLYESGNNPDEILKWARLGPIILTLLLITLVYFWSRDIMGSRWALLPTLMTGFSPTILAHGHYVTTDVGAALGFLTAIYFFARFLKRQTRKNLILAGAALGFAELLKFSAVLLFPLLFLILFVFWLAKKRQRSWYYLGRIFLIFFIAFLVVYPFYLIIGINYPPDKQVADTDLILSSFAGGSTPPGELCNPLRCLANFDVWAADKAFLRPVSHYLLGILMVMQRSAGGNTIYFMGNVFSNGSRDYFPIVYLLKESLAALTLITAALLLGFIRFARFILNRRRKFSDYLLTHVSEFSLGLLITVYVAYSLSSSLNIGVRHLLPIMPGIYILTAAGLKHRIQLSGKGVKRSFKLSLIFLVSLGLIAETALAYPYYLSYFNEIAGTANGWRYVTDSNYDWGQDLKRLKVFIDNTPEVDKIAIDYFGGGNPQYYLGDKAVAWQSSKGNPLHSDIHWLALSANTLQIAKGQLINGEKRDPENEYQWLQNPYEPYAVAGTSIFIYKLD